MSSTGSITPNVRTKVSLGMSPRNRHGTLRPSLKRPGQLVQRVVASDILAGGGTTTASTGGGSTGSGGGHTHGISGSIGAGGDHSHSLSGSVGSNGSDGAHENMPPYIGLTYIVRAL